MRKIEVQMSKRFEEIEKNMYDNCFKISSCFGLIGNRKDRYKKRLERLQSLLQKRAAIEERMLAVTRNVEQVMQFAEKALDSALKRRLQALGRLQDLSVGL